MDDRQSDDFVARARALSHRQAQNLTPEATRRLAAARREALARAGTSGWSPIWVPAGAVVAGLLVVAILPGHGPDTNFGEVVSAGPAIEDMEILFDEENLELLEELDFYAWLGTDPDAG